MKTMNRLAFTAFAAAFLAGNVHAANITWGSAQNITGPGDVSLWGNLVRAADLVPLSPNTTLNSGNASFTSALNTPETVNGVTFAAQTQPDPVGNLYTLANGDTFERSDTSRVGPGTGANRFVGFGGPNLNGTPQYGPFNTLVGESYQRLLSTSWWNDGDYLDPAATARYTATLNNLTIGLEYQLQAWVNDTRLANLGQDNPDLFTTLSDGVTSVDLQHNVDNILGGIGQYVIGTFTADATSQVVTFTGGNAPGVDIDTTSCTVLIAAYQLRAVPEPSTIALAGLGMVGLLMARRRAVR